MGRKVFEEHGFEIEGRILPLDKFKLFCDKKDGLTVSDEIKAQVFMQADEILQKDIPQLFASEYMMFRTNGNRTVYEKKFFERRENMFTLAFAEYLQKQGKYTSKLCDYVWLILEETTWVVPAHNKANDKDNAYLTNAYMEKVEYIDLFSAYTGACLAFVYYLCKDILNGVTTIIPDRILYELDKKIITPYLADYPTNAWWMGKRPGGANNWDPWINSNILTIAALTVEDTKKREEIVKMAMGALDKFTESYHPDGGCDEGPSYWRVAGGALYNACLALYDISDGYINIFNDQLIVNIAEYMAKAHISGDYFTNFADAPAQIRSVDHWQLDFRSVDHWQLDFAKFCNSRLMEDFSRYRLGGMAPAYVGAGHNCPYRLLHAYSYSTLPKAEYTPSKKVWLDGIGVAMTREYEQMGKGLYLAIKGGHNNESHNHNDVGSFIVFADGTPIFIDLGVGEYTKKTFSPDRYSIASMRSEFHNLPTFNGVGQKNGREYEAKEYKYNEENGGLELDVTSAYPENAGLERYSRRAELSGGAIKITDSFALKENGSVTFNLICRAEPKFIENGKFSVENRVAHFDESLEFSLEEIDCSSVEMKRLPILWDCEKLWRVKLSAAKIEAGKQYGFDLVVK